MLSTKLRWFLFCLHYSLPTFSFLYFRPFNENTTRARFRRLTFLVFLTVLAIIGFNSKLSLKPFVTFEFSNTFALVMFLLLIVYFPNIKTVKEIFCNSQNKLTNVVIAPILEEFYFKTFLISLCAGQKPTLSEILMFSTEFSFSHISVYLIENGFYELMSFWQVIAYTFFYSLLSWWVLVETGSIVACIVLHAFFNYFGLPKFLC